MKRVWKFPLVVESQQVVQMPRGARLLSAQVQGEKVCLWALCDDLAEPQPRHVVIVGTDHPLPDFGELVFIDTFQLHDGRLVFHVFELTDTRT